MTLPAALDSQAGAPFRTASLNDSPARFSRNASTETVRTSAVTSVWLMGSFRHN
jgi:hypothetical protein